MKIGVPISWRTVGKDFGEPAIALSTVITKKSDQGRIPIAPWSVPESLLILVNRVVPNGTLRGVEGEAKNLPYPIVAQL